MVRVSLLRRLFDGAYRRARRAEGRGDYRTAAIYYAEANASLEAANALLFLATRTSVPEERIAAYEDALRWLPPEHAKRTDVEARLGALVLEDAQRRGSLGREDRQRLERAAERLARVGRNAEAATAWELLGRKTEAAACLEAAGEVERLERLLAQTSAEEGRSARVRSLLATYEMELASGARREAKKVLQQAVDSAPEDPSLAEMLRRFDERSPRPFQVVLDLGGKRLTVVGRLPVTLGRAEADIRLRSASVSRNHARLDVRNGRVYVEDLGSRNGTLVHGIPIASEVGVTDGAELALGEDAALRVTGLSETFVSLDIVRGMDVGSRFLVGRGELPLLPGTFSVDFPEGHATLTAKGSHVQLGGQPCIVPIAVLVGDVIVVGGTRVEVLE